MAGDVDVAIIRQGLKESQDFDGMNHCTEQYDLRDESNGQQGNYRALPVQRTALGSSTGGA